MVLYGIAKITYHSLHYVRSEIHTRNLEASYGLGATTIPYFTVS